MLIGVDGCPGGWYSVHSARDDARLKWVVHNRFLDLLSTAPQGAIIAIDIPIGLLDAGTRLCDQAARQILSPRRHNSVFSAPLRPVLAAKSHVEASTIRRVLEHKGMSVQAFAITSKVREVDAALAESAERAGMVYEVHPEVSFAAMNAGVPLQFAKKKQEGRRERLALLQQCFGSEAERLQLERPRSSVEADDVLDALAALWSARRIQIGQGRSLPEVAEVDNSGRRMAIFY